MSTIDFKSGKIKIITLPNSVDIKYLYMMEGQKMVKFDNVESIKEYILFLKDNCYEESKWYEDLEWFSSINYTTTSEYFGELMLFLKQLINAEEMKKYKCELIELENVLKSYFN